MAVRWGGEMGRRERNSDLKRAKNVMRSNVVGAFDRIRAVCVCEVGAAFELTHVSSNAGLCLRSNVQGTVECMCAVVCL
jgi:hypothetical protein